MFFMKEYQPNSHAGSYTIWIFIFVYYSSWPGAGAETSTFRLQLRLRPKVPAPCGSGYTTLVIRYKKREVRSLRCLEWICNRELELCFHLYPNIYISRQRIWNSCLVHWEEGLWCALIKCTLGSGKSKKGWEFGGEGTREQWGTRGVSFRATWDWGGQFLSHLEGAK